MAIYNITVRVPKRGDIVVIDADKNYQYIALETFSALALPSSWQVVGEVFKVRGENVYVRHKTAALKKWVEVFLWKITGYSLDGADHTVSFTINSKTCSVTYNAADLASLATQLNAAVSAFDFGGHNYTVYVRGDDLVLQHNTYTIYLGVSASGVSVTQNVGPELTPSITMLRRNGSRSNEGSIFNRDRSLIYFMKDLSSSNHNPSSDVTSLQSRYPICLPAYLGTSKYQSDHCALLRSHYGEGVEGWLKFMRGMGVVNPWDYGVMAQDGKTNTYALAGQTYLASDGTQETLYPAFDYCADVEYDCDGLRKGDWYLPGIDAVADMVADITYPAVYDEDSGTSKYVTVADADALTRGANVIGGTIIANNTSVLSSCLFNFNHAWCHHGRFGFGCCYNLYNAYLAVPVTLLKVKAA